MWDSAQGTKCPHKCLPTRALVVPTRGLKRDGPCYFEPWSDDQDNTGTGTACPNFRTTPAPRSFWWTLNPM
ncbi:hypothetical protein AVEN_195797-1, partial [Araneus ventricosus]